MKEIFEEDGSSSDDGLYLINFRDFQFSQQTVLESKYVATTKAISKVELERKLDKIRDTKSLLLDSGSTFSVCNNPKVLINLRKCEKPISGVSNGGILTTDLEGDLPGFFTVYHNPESLMNILALSDMVKHFRVTMDTSVEVAMLVHINDTQVMRFTEIAAGLYIWKPETNTNLVNKQISSYSFLGLVSTNKSNYTRRELQRVDAAKKYTSI